MKNSKRKKIRYFYFVYQFYLSGIDGKGTLSVKSSQFPSQKYLKDEAIKQVINKYDDVKKDFGVIIENWIEMSKKDYKQFNK